MLKYDRNGVPTAFYNVVPFLRDSLGYNIPPPLDAKSGGAVSIDSLARILPREMVLQELNVGHYASTKYIPIPKEIRRLYAKFRETPVFRAQKFEQALGLSKVRIYCKREDANEIGSYKLNSSYVQAYYAAQEGVQEFIGDTGPGNWGLGMAVACRQFNLKATIYMEAANYERRIEKVRAMQRQGATVLPILTGKGTIAASVSVAVSHVYRHEKNRLSLGCLTAYSALHNTIIGLELKRQLEQLDVVPSVLLSVCGGGSSFSGLMFPFLESHRGISRFLAVESAAVPSFTRGEYRYENPDLIGLMPRSKMYTLGNDFAPDDLTASGLNYHGKNPLLSLMVHEGLVEAVAYDESVVQCSGELFHSAEGISPAPESMYAIHAAAEEARRLEGTDKAVVFMLTGNADSLEL